jgi:hypothetical protein
MCQIISVEVSTRLKLEARATLYLLILRLLRFFFAICLLMLPVAACLLFDRLMRALPL